MERCIFNVYKYSRLESARQSMEPESYMLSLLRKACFRNRHIKINVVVTQAIFDFCIMKLFQVRKCREKDVRTGHSGLGLISA